MSIEIIKTLDNLEKYVVPWDELANNSLETNPFYESWMFLPAWRKLGQNKDIQVMLIFSEESENKLIGLFPFVKDNSFHHVYCPHYVLWDYPQCFLCTPLIDKDDTNECLEIFFSWLKGKNNLIVRLRHIRGDGPFAEALTAFNKNCFYDKWSYDRALIETKLSFDDYIKEAMSSNARHELKRKMNKLLKLGDVEIKTLQADSDINFWLKAVLDLEHSGWKGKAGTSLISLPQQKEFYSEIFFEAFKRQQLTGQMMLLNNTPIAVIVEFLSKDDVYADKTAFDESYSKHSPGMHIFIEAAKYFLSQGKYNWIDSCAEPDQVAVNRMCSERRTITNFTYAPSGFSINSFFGKAIVMLMKLVHKYKKRPSGAEIKN